MRTLRDIAIDGLVGRAEEFARAGGRPRQVQNAPTRTVAESSPAPYQERERHLRGGIVGVQCDRQEQDRLRLRERPPLQGRIDGLHGAVGLDRRLPHAPTASNDFTHG